MRKPATVRLLPRILIIVVVPASLLVAPGVAEAATTCGTSSGHTLCVTLPDNPLSGPTPITVTNSPNSGTVIASWIASGKPGVSLIQDFAPSPQTNDYSFVWPTQKYLDASGVLRLQASSTGSTPIDVPVTLSNGNVSDFQHSPSDWANYLPGPWTLSSDPVIAAAGDGASDEPSANDNAQSIALSNPNLFLYLGDIYENGTFTENLNHYGQNSMDGGGGTLWGQMGTITQPTIADHEKPNRVAWQDYFHGRPLYTSFVFANVLFLDLASQVESMAQGSAQYNYVSNMLTSGTNPPPPCIIAFWHNPALTKDTIKTSRLAMWKLLTDNGGDLVLNGNMHAMTQYKPLNDQLQLPSAGQPTMVQLINGAGGHAMGNAFTGDPRVEWSQGKTAGAIYITPNGAGNGGTPTSLSWAYKNTNGSALHTGTRACGDSAPPAPSITGFSPTSGEVGSSVTIDGSGFAGATDVQFNGTSVGSGNFTIDSDTQITATVPSGAGTGPISITAPGGTATSSGDFTVTVPSGVLTFTPDEDTFVRADSPNAHPGSKISMSVDGSPLKDLLLKFTVSGVGASSIISAKVRLYCLDGATRGGDFHRVGDNSWQEETVTWNTAPTADAATIASLGPVTAGAWFEVDVSSLVTGDGTYSLRVTSVSSNGADYSTKEGTSGFAPQLVVALA
jgi:hypothetical protein